MAAAVVVLVLAVEDTPAAVLAQPPLFPQVLAWLLWSGKKWHTHEFKTT
jgi:hypothetical protein